MSSVPQFAVNMTTFTWMSSTASTSMIMTGDNWEYHTNANKHWGFWISPSSFLLPSQGQFSNHTVQIWYAYCQEYLLASHITLSRSVPKSDEVGVVEVPDNMHIKFGPCTCTTGRVCRYFLFFWYFLFCCTAMENSRSPPTWSESNPSECAMIQNHGLHAMFSFVRRHTISTWTAVPSYEKGV